MVKYLNTTSRMTIIATTCLLGLALTHALTQKKVQKNEVDHLQEILIKALPNDKTDNILINTQLDKDGYTFYQSCLDNQKNYLLMQSTTNQGYSGKIVMITSFDPSLRVYKILPLMHKETPGLGDKMEPQKSDWLKQFQHQSTQTKLSLKKDGGQIDAMAGATITSRAVTNLVNKELLYLKNNPITMKCYEN